MNCPKCGKGMHIPYADYYSARCSCDCGVSVRIETVDKTTKPLTVRTEVIDKDGKVVESKTGPGHY